LALVMLVTPPTAWLPRRTFTLNGCGCQLYVVS